MKLRAKISLIVICSITAATAFVACNKPDEVVITDSPTTTLLSPVETETTNTSVNSPIEKIELTTTVTTLPSTTVINDRYPNGNEDINADNIDRMKTGDIRDGDVIEEGDYIYTYYSHQNGWSVEVADKTQPKYGTIKSKLYDIPVVSMQGCFYKCNNMVSSPEIPNSIINMESCYVECANLTGEIVIPENVTNISYCFLTSSNDISSIKILSKNVTNASGAFDGCSTKNLLIHKDSITLSNVIASLPNDFSTIITYIPSS